MRAALFSVVSMSRLSKPVLSKPIVLLSLLSAALLSGCAANRSDSARLDCAALQQVMNTTRADLSDLVASKTNTTYGSVWRAKIDAYGRGCTLFSSTDVPSQYFCSIPAAADSSVLTALQGEVAGCLGPDWQRSSTPGGRGERFSRAGDNIVVDVGASDVAASRAEVIGLVVRRR